MLRKTMSIGVMAYAALLAFVPLQASADDKEFIGPLESWYDNQLRVEATAETWIEGGSHVNVDVWLHDPINDGNTVYARVRVYHDACTSDAQWCLVGSRQVGEINNIEQWSHLSFEIPDHFATKFRVVVDACAQMGWPVPDSCLTGSATLPF